MSDIIRKLRQIDEEAEARATRRQIARTIRAGQQPQPDAPPIYTPPTRPLVGGGVTPVFVLNMPRVFR